MSAPPIEVRVALADAAEDWVADLAARAGVPVEVTVVGVDASPPSAAPAPVVLIGGAIAVPDRWLALLLASVPEELATATVSCLAVPLDDPEALGRVSGGMSALGGPVAVDAPVGPCVLVTAGGRMLRGGRGLADLVSDRVVVGHAEPQQLGVRSPAAHAATWARRLAAGRPSITIDARSLEGDGAGTQLHTLELIGALAALDRLRIRVVLPPEPAPEALRALRAIDGLELRSYAEVVNAGIKTDVVHRPYQVFTIHDLRLLARLGERIVVTQQDQLLYRNAAYHGSTADWEAYRETCRIALAWADRTVFFSEHARREALRDELVDLARTVVVPIGTDHRMLTSGEPAERPDGLEALGERPFLLVLGTDLAHKNRPFAIALLRALREHEGWDGGLVLAGPRAEHGSLRDEEALPAGGGDPVAVLGRVTEAERRWLLAQCAAVVFPSTDEGFGLMPFEAGIAGTACLFAPVASLRELLPRETAVLVPWDAVASATAAAPLLADGSLRRRHVEALQAAAARFRWADAASALAEVYDDALRAPVRSASQLAAVDVERQAEYQEFRERLGEDAISLVGPQGALPPDVVRPLLGVASKRLLRRPLFALLKLLYRAGHRRG